MLHQTMQLFSSYRKISRAILNCIFLLSYGSSVSASSIGDVRESTGVTSILRNKESIQTEQVELYDQAQTAKGRMLIEFRDKAELQLKEHSLVLIDEIYYDPNPNLSKMSLKMAMGTARFASGRLGLVNKANIDIQTPTASIAVRGTDFTTTIDELGRSLVILLPDEFGNPSGEIIVSNEAGSITLTEAYAATMVSSVSTMPTQKVIINNITPALIDNMFIVNAPKEVQMAIDEQMQDDNNIDMGSLDADFLEFDELEKDFDDYAGGEVYTRLDYDFLGSNLLTDLLDVVEELIRTMEELEDVQDGASNTAIRLTGAKWGFNDDSQYAIYEEDGGIVFHRDVRGVISLKFAKGGAITVVTEVEGYVGEITADGGEDINVFIKQD